MENKINLCGTCVFCKKDQKICVNKSDYDRYMKGESYVQDLFPYLSSGDREFLISRTCNDCFEKMFSEEEDVDTTSLMG